MKTSSNGRQLIEKYEGLILSAYDDTNDHVVPVGGTVRGVLTIGYGHTSVAGPPKVYIGQTITKTEADSILSSDLQAVELEVSHLVRSALNQNQFDALVSFHFNTGALGRSTLLTKLNSGDYTGAADEFLKWNKAGGKVLEGLVKRREDERKLFNTPIVSQVPAPTPSLMDIILNFIISLFSKGK